MKLLRAELPTRGELSQQQIVDALSKAYQNFAVMKYLDEREEYLIYRSTNTLLDGHVDHAKGLAGQLLEIRMFRKRLKACYNFRKSQRAQEDFKRKSLLGKRVRRRHSQ